MNDQPQLPALESRLLKVFVSKRSLPFILEEIEERFFEIKVSKGFSEARKYLRWEIRWAAISWFWQHLKFVLVFEGISKLARLWL